MSTFAVKSSQSNLEKGLLSSDHLENEIEPIQSDSEYTTSPSRKTIFDLKWQILALSLTWQANAYIFISPLPYVAFMCISLVPGLTEQNAGTYAGVVSTMYVVGQACSSYGWSVIADKYGRRKALIWSNLLATIFQVGFGLSPSISMALIFRFLTGGGANSMGLVRIVCSEIAEGDKDLEGRVMTFVLGTRGWVSVYGLALSGLLSDPIKHYPHSWLSTTFNALLSEFPFVLPNIFGAFLTLSGLVSTYFFIPETRPAVNIERSSTITMRSIWKKKATRDHLIALWMYSFAAYSGVEAIPLFFVATDGGLSLQENLIGIVFTSAGVIFILFQYVTFKKLKNLFGLYGVMRIGSVFSIPTMILVPISLLLNRGQPPNSLSVQAFLYLVILDGIRRIATSIFFSSLALATNQSVKREEIAIMNGLSSLGGSLFQAIGPVSSGLIISFSLTSGIFDPEIGIYIPFGIVSAIAAFACVFVFVQLRKHHVVNENA